MTVRWSLAAFARVTVPVLSFMLLGSGSALAARDDAQVRGKLGGLRVPFIANEGQVDARVAYYAPTFAGTLFVTRQGELVYALPGPRSKAPRGKGPGWSLTETLVGGTTRPEAQNRSATSVGYFLGHDPASWRPALPTYEQLGLGQVWSGITVALHARGRSIEKVFTVQPGASVDRIRVRIRGADALSVDSAGALVTGTGLGSVTFTAPVAYQERAGVRHPVTVAYRLTGREYGFTVGAYDRNLPLVVDPVLQSTYLGGSNADEATALAIHPTTGDVYVAGTTASTNFPGTAGGAQATIVFGEHAFVARLNSALTSLIQATYLGSDFSRTTAMALAIHPTSGDVYVAGSTNSLPNTSGGAQPTQAGGFDGFVARFNSALTALTQATYLGGGGNDHAFALAIHPTTGDIYVAGQTGSSNFPGTIGGAQPVFSGPTPPLFNDFGGDAFVARLNSALTALTQATYLGGSSDNDGATALAIHPTTGDVYVAGQTFSTNFPGTTGGAQPTIGHFGDAFVARLSSDLTALGQATYFETTQFGGDVSETAEALAIHPTTGDVYVAGIASVADIGGEHAFVARYTASLTTLLHAVSLTGSDTGFGKSEALALAIHSTTGDVYIAGSTNVPDFPGTGGGAQPANGGGFDGMVARLSSDLSVLIQATYLGGTGDDFGSAIAIHPTTGDVYVAGKTLSTDFPGTLGGARPTSGGDNDAFVARLTSNLVGVPGPDLTLTKTHTGNFVRGQVGATYTLTVRNVGTLATTGLVTVTDTLPASLTATDLSGSGWGCTLGTLTCTRSDALASGLSYPAIILTVTVATNAPSSVMNTATVSGGGDVNPGNNTAVDPTTIVAPDLTVAKIHNGNFTRGQAGAIYTMTVGNVGTAATAGTVTVTDTLPASLTATDLSGSGWGCTLGTLTCTRGDALPSGFNYPVLILTATVAANAPSTVTNTVTVSGGGDVTPVNNTANDVTAITTFTDVAPTNPFIAWIEALFNDGFTAGCATSPRQYCPDGGVTRGQLAVFLLRGIHGAGFDPPAPTGTRFTDVPASHPFAKWIEQVALEGIIPGCTPTTYCPDVTPTRGQMAMFLLLAKHGAGFVPPAATGTRFTDVPASHPFAKWIEQLALEGITGGCGATTYCPDALVTRGQSAVFLVRTFNLPM